MNKILLVDFENLPKVDLSALPEDVHVPFFFGASQRTVPKALFDAAMKLGDRFISIDIEGQGKNALDFHIAYYLGELLAASPAADCVILSRDKGFDPLVRHLAGRGFHVRRTDSVADAFGEVSRPRRPAAKASVQAPAKAVAKAATKALTKAPTTAKPRSAPRHSEPRVEPKAARPPELERAVAHLRRTSERNRPTRRKKLAALLHSAFARKLEPAQVEALIDAMLAAGLLRTQGTELVYAVD